MNRHKALPLLAASFAAAFLAPATGARAQDVRISTILACSDWADARKKRSAVNLEHYVQGYLDGYSLAAKLDFWGSTEATRLAPAQAFNRMDDYCAANPKGNTLEGAHKLFTDRQQELAAARRKPEEKKKR